MIRRLLVVLALCCGAARADEPRTEPENLRVERPDALEVTFSGPFTSAVESAPISPTAIG